MGLNIQSDMTPCAGLDLCPGKSIARAIKITDATDMCAIRPRCVYHGGTPTSRNLRNFRTREINSMGSK
jgi:hypothetical protein